MVDVQGFERSVKRGGWGVLHLCEHVHAWMIVQGDAAAGGEYKHAYADNRVVHNGNGTGSGGAALRHCIVERQRQHDQALYARLKLKVAVRGGGRGVRDVSAMGGGTRG